MSEKCIFLQLRHQTGENFFFVRSEVYLLPGQSIVCLWKQTHRDFFHLTATWSCRVRHKFKKNKKTLLQKVRIADLHTKFLSFFYFFAPCRLTTDFGRIFTAPTWVCDAIVAPAVATFLPLLLVWTSRAAISFSQWSLACRYSIIVVLASSTDECSPSVQQDFGKNNK